MRQSVIISTVISTMILFAKFTNTAIEYGKRKKCEEDEHNEEKVETKT